MSEAILKALKWYVMALAGIVGASAFLMINKSGAVLPWIFVVLGFGVVYIMSYFWNEFRGKILIASFVVFLSLTVASSYTADVLYVFFDIDMLSYSKYFMWALTMLIGIPLMTLVFRYIRDE
ncbi:MAG: hypothetical protein KAJ29_05515 [Alphaproteobacteria bacterium]|nr:hypothetical protein [Alphaproteobacteria bacterium]